LMLVLMQPSVVRTTVVDQKARDFMVVVDTSRSMRHDTTVRRASVKLHFKRRAGTFGTVVDDPNTLPYLARYELERESLLHFLEKRRAEDRVGLIFFNDEAYTMSAPTSNIEFVTNQLASMDDYVNYGTDIAKAVDSGLKLLDRYPNRHKRTMILLTDAEARDTTNVEKELSRLAGQNVSFYLLWITTDEKAMSDPVVASFMNFARSVGKVITIKDLNARNMDNALLDISRQEAYTYKETRHQRIELSFALLRFTLLLLLAWLLLVATVFHPSSSGATFEGRMT